MLSFCPYTYLMRKVFVLVWTPRNAEPEVRAWLKLVCGTVIPGSRREEARRMRKRRGLFWRLLLLTRGLIPRDR